MAKGGQLKTKISREAVGVPHEEIKRSSFFVEVHELNPNSE